MSTRNYTGIIGAGEESEKDQVFVEARPNDAIPSLHLEVRTYGADGKYDGTTEIVVHLTDLNSDQLLGLSTSLTEASDAIGGLASKLEQEGR